MSLLRLRLAPVLLLMALAAVALALVACGGSSSPSGSTGGSPAASVPAGAPEIDQQDLAFKPTKLTVSAGTTVYFKNSESALHTVNINGDNASGTMRNGAVFAWTPTTAGTYKITCEFHPQMKATITVE